jgi:hypothetical protein
MAAFVKQAKKADKRHRPYSLRPRAGRLPISPHASKNPRARGTPGSRRTHGPRRLAASRRAEVRTASPPLPRRPARDVYRFAPSRPRWTDLFRQPASPCELKGCLSTAAGPGRARRTCDRLPFPPSRGPVARGKAGRDEAAWTAGRGNAPHLQRPQPATASRPASEDA